MTFQLLHSEFPYIWGKFDFLFYHWCFTAQVFPLLKKVKNTDKLWPWPPLTCTAVLDRFKFYYRRPSALPSYCEVHQEADKYLRETLQFSVICKLFTTSPRAPSIIHRRHLALASASLSSFQAASAGAFQEKDFKSISSVNSPSLIFALQMEMLFFPWGKKIDSFSNWGK